MTITTRSLPPTNPTAVLASNGNGNRLTAPWDASLSFEENHERAFARLAESLELCGLHAGAPWMLAGGVLGMVWVDVGAARTYAVFPGEGARP